MLWVSTSLQTRGGVSSYVRGMSATALADHWNIAHLATHRDGTSCHKIAQFARSIVVFGYLAVRDRPALVHLHVASRGSFLRKYIIFSLARAARLPVIAHIHGAEFDVFYASSPRLVQRAIRDMLAHSAAVVALGESWGRRLAEMEPRANVAVIPNPARPVAGVDQPAADQPVVVLFLGRIDDSKGVWALIEAWAKMLAHGGRPARLTLAGDGELERARAMIDDLGVSETVTVAGWVEPTEIPGLLRSAQILVLPSRCEGQSMAVLEAMANGMCVVVTPVGGMPELVANGCGILVPTDDVGALATALQDVTSNDRKRTQLGDAALQRIRDEYDIDVIWRRFDCLYHEVIR